MATTITVSKASSASSIDAVRHDDDIWQVSHEIEGHLATRDIQQVLASDIRALLATNHGHVDMTEGEYAYGVDIVPGLGPIPWCIKTHSIAVRDQPGDEPVIVNFETIAHYS